MTPIRTALVTGASSGIGAALALELARRGARVVLVARRTERLAEVAAEIRAAGGAADVDAVDVGDPEAVRAAVRRADAAVGGLELVVANAGVGRARHASALAWEDVEATLRVNVLGAFATLHAGLELFRARGRGTLCGVSSLAGLAGMPGSGAYPASKAALSNFLETLRIDLAGTGIAVVDVRPGFVVSEMTAGNDTPMPFLQPTARAARRIADACERGRGVATFPWQLALPLWAATRLPPDLWVALARRLASGRGKRGPRGERQG